MKKVVWLVVLGLVFLSCRPEIKIPKEKHPKKEIISSAEDRCVKLKVYDRSQEEISGGSGVIIDSNLVLTARHCIEEVGDFFQSYQTAECKFRIVWKGKSYSAQIVECDKLKEIDVILLKVKDSPFPGDKLLASDSLPSLIFWFDVIYSRRPRICFGQVNGIEVPPPNRIMLVIKKDSWPYPCILAQGGRAWPGLSGSAVYDFQGRLVGILVAGSFFNLYPIVIVPVSYFKDIF